MLTFVRTVDLSDDAEYRSGFPHDVFSWLRANDPVHWHEPTARTPDGEGFWVVSRYEDVKAVQLDPARFSSDKGGVRDMGGTALKDERTAGTMLNHTDDPQHGRLRTLVNRGFTPRAIGALEEELTQRAHDLADAMDGSEGPVNFVVEFGRELPAQAICIVLGVPDTDRVELLDWLDEGIETEAGSIFSPESMRQIRNYGRGLIADKRANPDGGIMATVVHARHEDDGTQLSDRELLDFFGLLFPAGAETTRNAISSAVLAFAAEPSQWDRLRADPSLIGGAVEEILRWATPSVYKRRTVSHDTELGNRTLRAGDKLTIWEMSANRDESVFADPFRFDVGRSPNPHLAFGWGVHFCLGASLARLELTVAIRVLAERYAGFEVAGPYGWMPNARLSGLKALPLQLIRD